MNRLQLSSIFIAVLGAASLGAKGGCGPCNVTEQTLTTTLLPPANGDAAIADSGLPPDAGALSHDECVARCNDSTVISCRYDTPGGVPSLHCVVPANCGGAGRRPEGLAEPEGLPAEALAAWFAHAAYLEAASVHAFDRLTRELHEHGAPPRLRRRSQRARKDEIRHARSMRSIATRFGARAPRPEAKAMAPRSLEAMALENAVEGCVRETYGALLATWQAAHVQDARIAPELRRVAKDETEHAALSWQVHAWALRRLPLDAAARVREAMARAVSKLEVDVSAPVPGPCLEAGLLPAPEVARELFRGLTSRLLDEPRTTA
jgi:hypothetical protein